MYMSTGALVKDESLCCCPYTNDILVYQGLLDYCINYAMY